MDQLGIFAKFWQPGRVKTRLAQDIGAANASRLYREFLSTLLTRLSGLGCRRVLSYTPDDRRAAFQGLLSWLDPHLGTASRARGRAGCGERRGGPRRRRGDPTHRHRPAAVRAFPGSSAVLHGWQLIPQGQGDLGERMRRYFERSFAQGARRVVLLGSDSPTVPAGYVRAAFALLREFPVVLGPSDDGGYYLVGARQRVPPIFSDMPWSSADLWEATRQRLARHGQAFGQLAPWYDVDNREDLERLRSELRTGGTGPGCLWLRRAVQRLDRPGELELGPQAGDLPTVRRIV